MIVTTCKLLFWKQQKGKNDDITQLKKTHREKTSNSNKIEKKKELNKEKQLRDIKQAI